jgi:hypothetical protein
MYSRRGLLVDRYPIRGGSNTISTTICDANLAMGSILSCAGYVAASCSAVSSPVEANPPPPPARSLAADISEQKLSQPI